MSRGQKWITPFRCSAIALSVFLTVQLSVLKAQVSVRNGVVISDELTVKFKLPVVNIPIGEKQATLQHIDAPMVQIRNYFGQFRQPVIFWKLIPDAKPEDTLYVSPAGEVKKLHNWSQVFRVKFAELVDLWKVIEELRKFPQVEYAEPPVQVIHNLTPNDLHKAGNQWYLTKVQAEQAWDITTGSSSLRIALIEAGVASHNDLAGKLVAGESGFSGYHGLWVAGVAGAATNNNLGIASLGWNVLLVPMNSGNGTGIDADIRNAANPNLNHKAKVINCSFKTVIILQDGRTQSYNYSSVAQAVADAQNYGALVIASAGNPPGPNDADVVPHTQWPAAYSGVIGVSATNSSDQFPSGYNYGSHVDVSGPAINILTLDQNNTYNRYDGTSFAAPLTSALAALIWSKNSNLTSTQVANTIFQSADDLGSSGWDDHFGYGRINANKGGPQSLRTASVFHYRIGFERSHERSDRRGCFWEPYRQ